MAERYRTVQYDGKTVIRRCDFRCPLTQLVTANRHYGILSARFNPETVVVGRAMPVLCVDVYEIPDEPYQQEITAVDSLKQDDVFVCSTNQSTVTVFGENSSQRRHVQEARGAIVDGFIRDVARS